MHTSLTFVLIHCKCGFVDNMKQVRVLTRVQFVGGVRDLSLLQNIQTSSGAHLATRSVSTECSVTRCETPGT